MSRRLLYLYALHRSTLPSHPSTALRTPIINLRAYAIHPQQASSTKPSSTLPGAPESGSAETHSSASTPQSQPPHQTGYQPPTPPSQSSPGSAAVDAEEKEPSRPNIYALFGRPFAKVFLGAMFTYQVLYYAWERMRLSEVQEEKMGEMKMLEGELEGYKRRRGSGVS